MRKFRTARARVGSTFSLMPPSIIVAAVVVRSIASVAGTNNWLGRSNYSVDPYFGGVYDEFRIYDVALTVAQLRTSRAAGPDATFF